MTTEGRPFLGLEPEITYAEQRKCRMQDAIDDYLTDDKVTARRTYEDMLACVEDLIKYHDKELSKANELYQLMLGQRGVESLNSPGLTD